jgi:hypothetical protein
MFGTEKALANSAPLLRSCAEHKDTLKFKGHTITSFSQKSDFTVEIQLLTDREFAEQQIMDLVDSLSAGSVLEAEFQVFSLHGIREKGSYDEFIYKPSKEGVVGYMMKKHLPFEGCPVRDSAYSPYITSDGAEWDNEIAACEHAIKFHHTLTTTWYKWEGW